MNDLLSRSLSVFFEGLDALEVVANVNGESRSFKAYLDSPWALHESHGMQLETADYVLTAMDSDVAGFERNETTVQIEGHPEFVVVEIRPNGTGITEIDLAVL